MKKLTAAEKFKIERDLLEEWFDTLPPGADRNLGDFEKWRKERIKERGLKL
jgi:hypothetical protein